MSYKLTALLILTLGTAAACHHDQGTPTNAGAATNNGPATAGGASTQNSVTGGPEGSAPGDRYNNAGVDPATGMSTDGGVGDAGMR